MVENVLEKLVNLFTEGQANFRVLEHAAAGKSSQSVAEIRGTELGQGAKALVCHIKGNGVKLYALAILPADKQADLAKLAQALGGRRASLASPEEVLYSRYDELAFNAGHLDHSIIIKTEDYKRIVHPELIEFLKENPQLA